MLRAPILFSRVVLGTPLRRNFGSATENIPGFLVPIFNYASDAYITEGIQAGIEGLHALDVPWVPSFVIAGITLRILTSPVHILGEKFFARRLHLSNYLTGQMYKKVSERHAIPMGVDSETNELKFNHPNPELNEKADTMVKSALHSYFRDNRLTQPRIMFMKFSTFPLWIFSSFAIRNILTTDFGVNLGGFLWVNNFLEADPYFILPVAVGLLGFLNFYSNRIIFPSKKGKTNLKIYDGLLLTSTVVGVAVLLNMPACLSLYFLSVSLTGIIQSLLLRHPKVKELVGIQRLPWDSKTPLRDLLLLRKRQLS